MIHHYVVSYACENHGIGVRAIDRMWCVECLVHLGVWTKVEHVAEEVPDWWASSRRSWSVSSCCSTGRRGFGGEGA